MPLPLSPTSSTLAIRREAFERAGLTRESIDTILNLADDEFRVEGALIAIGPLPSPDDVPQLIDLFEDAGLVYFDDFVEIPGGFPDWIVLYARHA
jgi:8-oxo-dGTP pyrophosphatase MutT (NUDIX family)